MLQQFGGGPGSGFYNGFDANSIWGYGQDPSAQSGLATLGLGQVPGAGQTPAPGNASPIAMQADPTGSAGTPGPFQQGYTGAGFQPGQPGYGYGVLSPWAQFDSQTSGWGSPAYHPAQSIQNNQSAYGQGMGTMGSYQPTTQPSYSHPAPSIAQEGYQTAPPTPFSGQSYQSGQANQSGHFGNYQSPMQNMLSLIQRPPQGGLQRGGMLATPRLPNGGTASPPTPQPTGGTWNAPGTQGSASGWIPSAPQRPTVDTRPLPSGFHIQNYLPVAPRQTNPMVYRM